MKTVTNQVPSIEVPDDELHLGCITCLTEEQDYWVDDVSGTIPQELHGTLMRNGPGKFVVGDEPVGHWFDGDGMVAAISFANGKARFKTRFVQTRKLKEEAAAGRRLYTGLGTQLPGGWKKNLFKQPANTSNTNLVWHGNTFLSTSDFGGPYALDPNDLTSRGFFNYDGELGLGNNFSPHGKHHTPTGDYVNFGYGMGRPRFGMPGFGIYFYRVGKNGKVRKRNFTKVKRMGFIHDFALSENFALFILNSVKIIRPWAILLGLDKPGDNVVFAEDLPAELMVVDLHSLEVVNRYDISPQLTVHFGNGFEKNGEICFDAFAYHEPNLIQQVGNIYDPAFSVVGAQSTRYTVAKNRKSVTHRPSVEGALDADFGQWDQRKSNDEARFQYNIVNLDNGNGRIYNTIQKLDLLNNTSQHVALGKGRFLGEPQFVPRHPKAEEGDGFVIFFGHNGNINRGEVTILDAQNLENEIARITLRHHLPHGFHGLYMADHLLS